MNGGSDLPPPPARPSIDVGAYDQRHALAQPAQPRPTAAFGLQPWQLGALAGAIAIAVGSVLPWATVQTVFGSLSAAGTDGDGVITLACAGAVVLGALTRGWWLVIVGGIAAGALAGNAWRNVREAIEDVDETVARASVGVGVYVVLAGAVAAVVFGWQARTQRT